MQPRHGQIGVMRKPTHNFKAGQMVALRTGGPAMTVNHAGIEFVDCTWFVGHARSAGRFSANAVVAFKPPAARAIFVDSYLSRVDELCSSLGASDFVRQTARRFVGSTFTPCDPETAVQSAQDRECINKHFRTGRLTGRLALASRKR